MAMPSAFPCKVDMFHTITRAAQRKGHSNMPVKLQKTASVSTPVAPAHVLAIERRSHQPMDALVKQMIQVAGIAW